ncbi:MAG TPA: alpha/beta hydrolase [Leclercia adecarboxylata]|nr:alpha/beta hydrolase [Leclercia adecarboxylata]
MQFMNTQEIIELLAKYFKQDNGDFNLPFQQWLAIYRTWERNNDIITEEKVLNLLPLREPIVKLIYKKTCQKMPFDRDYILKHYERTKNNIEYLVYPSKNPERLIILLSGYSQRKTYNRYSWYWDEYELWSGNNVCLFMNDVENTWYCGHDSDKLSQYKEIIKSVQNEFNLNAHNTFIIGGSMGGYGALRLGYEMNLRGIISINPQTSKEAAKLHNDTSWYDCIDKCNDKFISAQEIIKRNQGTKLYFECGNYPADIFDLNDIIINSAKNNNLLLLNPHSSKKHVTISPSKEQVDTLINFFESDSISIYAAEKNADVADTSIQ